jgi:hypothetical protein
MNADNWNLFFFQGGTPNQLHGLWNVSISSNPNGQLKLIALRSLTTSPAPSVNDFPVLPIGKWFQIEVYFRRAADATGELSVFQDGKNVYRSAGIITDDSSWGQWYVGNLATALMPSDSTVYVDDVMIRATQ